MIDEIIGQGLGFLAMVLTIISYQMNTKSSYLMISTVATLSTCLGFYSSARLQALR